MSKSYKAPGVYIEEIPKLPPSVAALATAVPVFIGYTESVEYNGLSTLNIPVQVKSMADYFSRFGGAKPHSISVMLDSEQQLQDEVIVEPYHFFLFHAMQLFFLNGGGCCYIISCGTWPAVIDEESSFMAQSTALYAAAQEPSITIIVLPEAALCGRGNFYRLFQQALIQCYTLHNRVVLVDIFIENLNEPFNDIEASFREKIGDRHLNFGSAYYPYLQTTLRTSIDEQSENINVGDFNFKLRLPDDDPNADFTRSLYHVYPALYAAIRQSIDKNKVVLPPSPAIAGIMCSIDNSRGVWKAPANVSLNAVEKPMVAINDADQEAMNVHITGKSVNAIRIFPGKGTLVWGARTLAGNDNEWRYINVRRFVNFVEASVRSALQPFVFEPNDANNWVKIKAMIENFLFINWRQGALAGSKPEHAFFVKVGLNETMTPVDIFEGRLIIEIGLAVIRPAEFIISRLSVRIQQS